MIEIQPVERVEIAKRIDQIRLRIAAIENKIGINGVDFQMTLEREIARQAKVQKPQAVSEIQNLPGVTQPVNANDVANSAKVAKALREAEKIEANRNENKSYPAQNYIPGEEAFPSKINPSQHSSSKIERVEVPNTDIKVPDRDEKVFEDNYSGKNAEIISTEDLIMQTADAYGVTPQLVKGIVEYINQNQFMQVDEPFKVPSRVDYNMETSTEELLTRTANEYGVDPQLVKAIAIAESDMNQDEISPVGAIGVMQLMPETRYLKQMLEIFDGNIPLAVAAYNAGPAAVKRYGGIPPYAETINYVGRVMDMYQ